MSAGGPLSASTGAVPLAEAIDRLGERVGRVLSWLTLACVIVCFGVVVLRYGFGTGHIWMQELYVWLHAIVFTGCAAYALQHDTHVRVDVLRSRMSERTSAWVELGGATLMILPWMAVLGWFAGPWFWRSWRTGEASGASGGMPAQYLLKGMLLVMSLQLAIQAIAIALRAASRLRRG
jgi:TRAP-type mannitol/chloroaromatic compound transport system permease small subunit